MLVIMLNETPVMLNIIDKRLLRNTILSIKLLISCCITYLDNTHHVGAFYWTKAVSSRSGLVSYAFFSCNRSDNIYHIYLCFQINFRQEVLNIFMVVNNYITLRNFIDKFQSSFVGLPISLLIESFSVNVRIIMKAVLNRWLWYRKCCL